MFRSALLAIALLIPATLQAGALQSADSPGTPPCSDQIKGFPPCSIPKADKKKARQLYDEAMKLERHHHLDEALLKLKAARAVSPQDTAYQTAAQNLIGKMLTDALDRGNQAMLRGDAVTALQAFRQAVEIDPANDYAEQRLRDALPAPEEFASAMLRPPIGETHLQPKPGSQPFEFRGQSLAAFEKFDSMFGITTIADQGFTQRAERIKLDAVDWQTGSQILQRLCKVLVIPLTEHQVLIANDTEENRRDLTRMVLQTFYAHGGTTPAELTDLTTALRVMFDLRFITPNAAEGSLVIRAPQATMNALTHFLDDMQNDRPSVMIAVRVFEISTSFTRDLGTSVPNQFSAFNIPSTISSLTGSASYQQIVAALTASGQAVNTATILAALLASSSSTSTSSPLTQPFAVFGGGQTLTGVTIPALTLHFSDNRSLARTVQDVVLRSVDGQAATLKVGERYPIVSSTFSATSAASSLLSSIGINSSAGAAAVPSPQFTYEDIGMVLKTTPHVHGKLISMEYELAVRALGTTQSNGLPLLTNREVKGTIGTDDGQSIVIAGLLDKEETAALNGIPVVSALPGLGTAMSVQTREKTYDELLIVIQPTLTSGRGAHGVYLSLPTNNPK